MKPYGFVGTHSIYPDDLSTQVQLTGSSSPSRPPNPPVPTTQFPYIAEEALVRVQYRAQRSSKILYDEFRAAKLQEEARKMTTDLTRDIVSAIQPPPIQESFDSGIADQDFDQLLGELQGIGQPPVLSMQPLQAAMASLRAVIHPS